MRLTKKRRDDGGKKERNERGGKGEGQETEGARRERPARRRLGRLALSQGLRHAVYNSARDLALPALSLETGQRKNALSGSLLSMIQRQPWRWLSHPPVNAGTSEHLNFPKNPVSSSFHWALDTLFRVSTITYHPQPLVLTQAPEMLTGFWLFCPE